MYAKYIMLVALGIYVQMCSYGLRLRPLTAKRGTFLLRGTRFVTTPSDIRDKS